MVETDQARSERIARAFEQRGKTRTARQVRRQAVQRAERQSMIEQAQAEQNRLNEAQRIQQEAAQRARQEANKWENVAQQYDQSARDLQAQLDALTSKYPIDDRGRYVYVRAPLSRAERNQISAEYRRLKERVMRARELASNAREKGAYRADKIERNAEVKALRAQGYSNKEANDEVFGRNRGSRADRAGERAAQEEANRQAAIEQRERFLASGKSKQATPEQVRAAQVSQIKKGNLQVIDPQTGKAFTLGPNDTLISVRQPTPKSVPPARQQPQAVPSQRVLRVPSVTDPAFITSSQIANIVSGGPQQVASVEFGRPATPQGFREEVGAVFGKQPQREEVSRRSDIFRQTVVIPDQPTAERLGFPSAGTYEILTEQREDFPRKTFVQREFPRTASAVEKAQEKIAEFDDAAVRLAATADKPRAELTTTEAALRPAANVLRGVQEIGKNVEKGGAFVARQGERLQASRLVSAQEAIPFTKQLPGTPANVANALQVVGGIVEETGKSFRERPLTAGATEAVLIGTGAGVVSKGAKAVKASRFVARGGRAGRLVGAAAAGVGIAEKGAAVVLGGAFVAQTGVEVSRAETPREAGQVIGKAGIQLVGFAVGFKAGAGIVSGTTGAVEAVRTRRAISKVNQRLAGQLVTQAGDFVKVGERQVTNTRAQAEELRFQARAERSRLTRLERQETKLKSELARRQRFEQDVFQAQYGQKPRVEVLQTEGETPGILSRFKTPRDEAIATEIVARNKRLQGAREVLGSQRPRDRSVFRNKQRRLALEREEIPGVQSKIASSRNRIDRLTSEASRVRKQPDIFEPVYEFRVRDRELARTTREVGLEVRGRTIERDVFEFREVTRLGISSQEVRGQRVLGKEQLIRPEDLVRDSDTFLARAKVETAKATSQPSVRDGRRVSQPGVLEVQRTTRQALFTARQLVQREPRGAEIGVLRVEPTDFSPRLQRVTAGRAVVEYEPIQLSAERSVVARKGRAQRGTAARKLTVEQKRLPGEARPKELEKVVRFQEEPGPTQRVLETKGVLGFERGRAQLLVRKDTGAFALKEFTEFRKFQRGTGGIPGRPSFSTGTLTGEALQGLKRPVVISRITKAARKAEKKGGTEVAATGTEAVSRSGSQVLLQQRAAPQETRQETRTIQETRKETAQLQETQQKAKESPQRGTETLADALTRQRKAFASKFKEAAATRFGQRAGTRSALDLRAAPALTQKSGSKSLQQQVSKIEQASAELQAFETAQAQTLLQDQAQLTRQRTRQQQRTRTLRDSTLRRSLEETAEITTPGGGLDLPEFNRGGVQGFALKIKRGGIFKRVPGVFTEGGAQLRGAKITDTTAAQTFEITPVDEEVTVKGEPTALQLAAALKGFKQKGNLFREQRGKSLIDTPGEIQQIQRLGVRASQRRRL